MKKVTRYEIRYWPTPTPTPTSYSKGAGRKLYVRGRALKILSFLKKRGIDAFLEKWIINEPKKVA
jgi:hypothetical protein